MAFPIPKRDTHAIGNAADTLPMRDLVLTLVFVGMLVAPAMVGAIISRNHTVRPDEKD